MDKVQFQKHCELQALWWIAAATTGHHARTAEVYKGGPDGARLTSEELTSRALEIAQNHIRLYRESCDGTL